MGVSTTKSRDSRDSLNESDIEQWLNSGVIFSCQSGKILIAWGKSYWSSNPEGTDSSWFYFPDFFLTIKQPWVHFEHSAIISIDQLLLLLEEIPLEVPLPLKWENPSKEIFEKGFNDLQKLFRETELKKVVLYALSNSPTPLTPAHRKQALLNILHYLRDAPVFAYGFWNDSEGILGATPELLFRLEHTTPPVLQTMALAGTQKSGETSQMLHDEKLLLEHLIVVDDILTKLTKLGEVTLGQLQVLSLPVLSHLYTPISVKLHHSQSFSSIVAALHPTPALGGFPKEFALKWLSEYNNLIPRGRFGAPVGFWDHRSLQNVCYVGIRNVMWDANGSVIGAGCGIIAESSLKNEWEEVLLKTKSITRFLHL